MTEEVVIHEIRIDEVTGRSDSDSRMMSLEVIMPLKFQSTIKPYCNVRRTPTDATKLDGFC